MNGGKSRSPKILILSYAQDRTAEKVELLLQKRDVEFLHLDTADYPTRAWIVVRCDSGSPATIVGQDGEQAGLGQVRAIWYRHPGNFRADSRLSGADKAFVVTEAGLAIGGMLRNLDARWMNHPAAIGEARHKLTQLDRARQLGLRIPASLVTNSHEAAQGFLSSHTESIIKVLGNPVVTNEAAPPGPARSGIIFTSEISAGDLADADRVRLSPCFLQEKIEKKVDLRIVTVDDRVFAVAIESQALGESRTDYRRRVKWLNHYQIDLPGSVQRPVLALVHSFGLRFGVVDMALTPDDEYVFFEVNSNGQWLWLEDAAGVNISGAIADALATDAQA